MLQVRDLRHSFGDREVLKGISIEAHPGEILAVMGSSGGGKTTLLKCISGLITPTQGEIEVAGVNMITQPDLAREKLGLVFQYAALFDYLNVEDNILFGAGRRRKLSKQNRQELVKKSLASVGLSGVEKMMPSELSGGMRKRVGLARALALKPSLLLYDEPTSGLDPITAYAIDRLIVETRDNSGSASIVVSHDLASVMRVADRIAFLDMGEVVFLGSPDEFREASQSSIRELVEKAQTETFTASELA